MINIRPKVLRAMGIGLLLTACFFLGAMPAWAEESRVSASGNMIVYEPDEGELIDNPVLITGEARVFENTVEYRMTDANGVLLVKGFTTAHSPDVGAFGAFQIYATYTPPETDTGTLEVFSSSPEDGSEINKVTIAVRFTATSETPAQPTQRLYRLWNDRVGDHFYTTSEVERDTAASRMGYAFEGTAGMIFPNQVEDTVPLYRLYQSRSGDHFYTISAFERDNAISQYGYVSEGITGYIRPSDTSGTALYRLFNRSIQDHFYTVNIEERDAAVPKGYAQEGVTGYIGQPPQTNLVQVYFGNTVFDPAHTDCAQVFPVTREVPKTLAIGRAAIEELLMGPTSSEASLGYWTSIPTGVELQDLEIQNATAFADFNEELNDASGSCRVTHVRSQIETTLLQFPTVDDVVITVNEESEGVLQP